jgi:hypothetical protein
MTPKELDEIDQDCIRAPSAYCNRINITIQWLRLRCRLRSRKFKKSATRTGIQRIGSSQNQADVSGHSSFREIIFVFLNFRGP